MPHIPITRIRPLCKGRAEAACERLRVAASGEVIGDHVPVKVNIDDRCALCGNLLLSINRLNMEPSIGFICKTLVLVSISSDLDVRCSVIIGFRYWEGVVSHGGSGHSYGLFIIVTVADYFLLPNNYTIACFGRLSPVSVNPSVYGNVRTEGKDIACSLAVTLAGRVFRIPIVKGIAGTGGIGRARGMTADGNELRLGIGGVGKVLFKDEPVALLRVCPQNIALLRQLKGGITDLAEHHLAGNLRLDLLPAHELSNDAFLTGGIGCVVLSHFILRSGSLVSGNILLVDLDHDAALIHVCDRVGLEGHGIVVQRIAVLDSAGFVQLSRDIIANVGDRLAAGCIIGSIRRLVLDPALEHGTFRNCAGTWIKDVLPDLIQLTLGNHLGGGRSVELMENDAQTGVLAGLDHNVD